MSRAHGLGPRHMRVSINPAQAQSNRFSTGRPSPVHGTGPRHAKSHNPFKQRKKR